MLRPTLIAKFVRRHVIYVIAPKEMWDPFLLRVIVFEEWNKVLICQ